MSVDIIQGECRAVLAGLPAESVHTCITSPPFYALRDYKLPPSVWGGDPDCVHDWGQWDEAHDEREEVAHGKTRTTERCYGEASRRFDGNHQKHTAGAFCRLCGAWLGCLGLEPTPALYIAHLVDVFAAVHRVLHPSGTAWLNLGDSFAGSWGNYAPGGITHTQRERTEQGERWERKAYGDTTFKPPSATAKGFKPKDLMMLPHRAAIALQEWGWWIRSTIVWSKSNPMPESITDRPTQSHEYVFLLAKSERYFYDQDAIREPHHGYRQAGPNALRGQVELRPRGNLQSVTEQSYHANGRNKRSVWTLATQPYEEAHFATFPEALITPMVLAGTSEAGCCTQCGRSWWRLTDVAYDNPGHRTTNGPRSLERRHETAGFASRLERQSVTVGWEPTCDCQAGTRPAVVLDPFAGSGTVGLVAKRLGRSAILVEQSEQYCQLAQERVDSVPYSLFSPASSATGAAR